MRLFILLLLFVCCPTYSIAAPPAADPAIVQQTREDVIRLQERLDATRRDLDRQRQDQAEMEARVKALLADKEKGQEEAQQRQDDRISDIGQGVDRLGIYVALVSLLITVGGGLLGVTGWFRIKGYAEKWEQDAAAKLKELEERQKAAIAEMEQSSEAHLANMVKLHEQATVKSKEITALTGQTSAFAVEQSSAPPSAAAAAAQQANATPNNKRTPADWLVLGNKALSDEAYNDALELFDKALTHPEASNVERAQAVNGRGIALGKQRLHAAAATAFDLAFQFANTDTSPTGRRQSAMALFNRAIAVGETDGAAEIEIYDDIIRRFGDDTHPDLQMRVAKALFNKAIKAGQTDSAAEIAIYDEIVSRYGDDSKPEIQEIVAKALFNKGSQISKTNPSSSIKIYDNIISRYGDSNRPEILERVARALVNKGITVGKTNKAAAIAIFDDIIRRYSRNTHPNLREQVAKALFNKGIAIRKTNPAAAIANFEDILSRYGDDPALKAVTDRAKTEIAALRES